MLQLFRGFGEKCGKVALCRSYFDPEIRLWKCLRMNDRGAPTKRRLSALCFFRKVVVIWVFFCSFARSNCCSLFAVLSFKIKFSSRMCHGCVTDITALQLSKSVVVRLSMAWHLNTLISSGSWHRATHFRHFFFWWAIEALAIVIRKNVDIKGFIFGNEETKVLQYADDTITVLAGHSTCGHKLGYWNVCFNLFYWILSRTLVYISTAPKLTLCGF